MQWDCVPDIANFFEEFDRAPFNLVRLPVRYDLSSRRTQSLTRSGCRGETVTSSLGSIGSEPAIAITNRERGFVMVDGVTREL